MTILERIEIGAIIVLTATVWYIGSILPLHMRVANLFLLLSSLLLLQSLIRDLLIVFIQRKKNRMLSRRVARCMCIESSVGATGVLIGIVLIGLGSSSSIVMNQILWTLCALIITATGFLIKDLVFQWSPWRIYREKDHQNIIFSWKNPNI